MNASLRRVWGLMYRHLALYRRSWPRTLELMYWPVLQMCIWGFTASFLAGRANSGVILASSALLGGVLQVLLTMVLAGGVASAIGASIHEGVFIGALVQSSEP